MLDTGRRQPISAIEQSAAIMDAALDGPRGTSKAWARQMLASLIEARLTTDEAAVLRTLIGAKLLHRDGLNIHSLIDEAKSLAAELQIVEARANAT